MTVIWFTGLPCSGKTTIADNLAKKLKKLGLKVERLDGDIVRKRLSKDLGFTREDRDKNIDRISFISNLLSRNGVIVLASFVSPFRKHRRMAREEIGDRFIEVFVNCPVEECIKRDVKGLYRRALNGEIKGFTGVDDPYEKPLNPEIVVNTHMETVEESVEKIFNKLVEIGVIDIGEQTTWRRINK